MVQLSNIEPDGCHLDENLENIKGYESEEECDKAYKELQRRVQDGELSDDGDPMYGEVEVENDNEEDHYGDLQQSDEEEETESNKDAGESDKDEEGESDK